MSDDNHIQRLELISGTPITDENRIADTTFYVDPEGQCVTFYNNGRWHTQNFDGVEIKFPNRDMFEDEQGVVHLVAWDDDERGYELVPLGTQGFTYPEHPTWIYKGTCVNGAPPTPDEA